MSTKKSFSTETSERYSRALFEVSRESDELEKIDNVSTVEITVSQNSDLLEPPFGDKYLGFVFSQANEKVLVINALMKAMSTSMPIIK